MSFNQGLSIITGETGAGKSILLGGLGLILGKRADLSAVKDSSEKCFVEAVFNISQYNLKEFFEEVQLDYENQTIIRREILPSGKSRAFVNDTPVNLQALQELGDKLLDIHSQHQTLQLTNDDFQFKLLDALAQNGDLIDSYQENLGEYRTVRQKLKNLQIQKFELIKELDYNTFLLSELDEAQLESDNLQELEEELETLSNVEIIQEKLANVNQLLTADEIGAIQTLGEAKINLSRIASVKAAFSEIHKRLESSIIELNDILDEVQSLYEGLENDPDRMEFVSNRLTLLNNLLHKHHVGSIEELKEIREDLRKKVDVTIQMDEQIEKTELQIKKLEGQLENFGKKIHDNRVQIVPHLKSDLEQILSKLGMQNAKFEINLIPIQNYLENGMDNLEFMFTANKGNQMNELKKAASGGELSRIMLAIKFIISKYVQLPTIMFDEIDTGVSGEVSNKMAQILQEMSQSMQVFSITHLPQIAAKGDYHYKVYKKDVGDVTNTYLAELKGDDRIVEIAEMLGGTSLSNSAIAHAKELLN